MGGVSVIELNDLSKDLIKGKSYSKDVTETMTIAQIIGSFIDQNKLKHYFWRDVNFSFETTN